MVRTSTPKAKVQSGGGLQPQATYGDVASLISGVSQQPPNIRFANQCDDVVNCMPTIQKQCGRRPPLETQFHLTTLASSLVVGQPDGLLLSMTKPGMPYTHWYRRDANEAWTIIMTGTGIKAYNYLTGMEAVVSLATPPSDNYHLSDTPVTDFYCYTFKDVTFVVNRTKTPQMSYGQNNTPVGLTLALAEQNNAGISQTRTPEGIIVVKDAVNLASYAGTVTIGNTAISIGTISAASTDTTATVATAIKSAINSAVVSAGGTVTVVQNVIWISHPTQNIQLSVSDNRAGTAINSFTQALIKSTDLPAYAPNGYQVKVTGGTTTSDTQGQDTSTNTYYQFATSDGSAMNQGTWVETIEGGIPYQIDSALMPHQLTRNADGTFTWRQISWSPRQVGDLVNNPDPLFIGFPVHSIFLSNNRFGMLAGGSFNMSRVNEQNYFNFFRTTMLTSLDSDPVFGNIPSSQVNKVYWAIQWNGELIIFGDSVDGAVAWQTTLAPSKISIDTPTHFGANPLCPPFVSGQSIYFTKSRGNFTILYEYHLDPVTALKTADNLTSYLGSYIPKDVIQLVGLEKDFMVMLADGNRQSLFPYNYSVVQTRGVQQAFHRWDFSQNITIVSIFQDTTDYLLHVLYQFNGEYFLGAMDINVGATDSPYPDKVSLDVRLTETPCTTVYNPTTNRTTVTLPWSYGTETKVLEVRQPLTNVNGDQFPLGWLIPIESQTPTTLTLVGNWEKTQYFVGIRYSSYFDPTRFYPFRQNSTLSPYSGGNYVADSWKRVTVKRLLLCYANTGFFKVQILDRITGALVSEREFTLENLDNVETFFDQYYLYTGEELVMIEKPQKRYKIRIINDSTRPSYFTSLFWYGEYWEAMQ